MDGVRAVGITSRTLSKAKKLANTSQIEQVYNSVNHLLKGCALDAIMVLVSANQIYEVTRNLIPFKIPLFIEKPPGLLPKQAKSLTDLAKIHGTKNMVGFNRRYYSVFHEGIKIIKKSGDLLGLEVKGHERFWNIMGNKISKDVIENWIYANSTHTIDLLRFFGGEIKNINMYSKKYKQKNGDQFVASMEFKSGAIGTYTSHWFSPGGWEVTLYGESVTVKFKPLEKGVWIDTDLSKHNIEPDEMDTKYKAGFFRQMNAFATMVLNGNLEPPGINLEQALKTMELAKEFVNA